MSYRFIRCETARNVEGWWLVLEASDLDTEMKVHRGVVAQAYHRFCRDPHMSEVVGNQRVAKNEIADMLNPARIGAGFLTTRWKLGGVVLVNSVGGMCPFDHRIVVHAELILDSLDWPQILEGEEIAVTQFPDGKHWYLKSNKGRIFDPIKFDTFRQAEKHAEKFVTREQISERPHQYVTIVPASQPHASPMRLLPSSAQPFRPLASRRAEAGRL